MACTAFSAAAVFCIVFGACTSVETGSTYIEGSETVMLGEVAEGLPRIVESDTQDETGIPETEVREELQEGWREDHVKVRGIYVTGPIAGHAMMKDLIELVDETELNAMVIDVKNDDGNITYNMDLERARELGACIRYIPDMGELMEDLKEHDIYTIARIVCFKDPYLARDPEVALKKLDGTPVTDANGLAFVNPYRKEVWEYLVDVAEKAAEQGFDEIQFDYVRFPVGEDAEAVDYGVDIAEYPREQAITDFLQYAVDRLHEKDIVLGADVFGTIIESETDIDRVGQNYETLGGVLDVLSPMVYPSHYGPGVFGLEVPDAHPYETVFSALQGSARKLESVPAGQRAVVRPWLQAFTASWVAGYIPYEGQEIRAQIQAVYDAGYDEWILWNATNRYSADGLNLTEAVHLLEDRYRYAV